VTERKNRADVLNRKVCREVAMYTVSVSRNLTARHYLVGGDWNGENEEHSHDYRLEVRIEGEALDEHGYVIDICELESILDDQVAYFGGRSLNGLPEFEALNPSIEHFARILCRRITGRLQPGAGVSAVAVRIWESDQAWAEFRDSKACESV
jgi:6-pyruvoyltetrahydropterin/6-carboxytetrahydropterin synthase